MFVVLGMESVSCHCSSASNFQVASMFLENLFTPSLMVSIFESLEWHCNYVYCLRAFKFYFLLTLREFQTGTV